MNCGKTTVLLQVAHNYEEKGKKIIIIKPKVDKKGNDKVVSRIGLERKVDYLIDKDDKIKLINLKDIACILVDEAQFLTEFQIDELFIIAKQNNIPVICYGLKTDFQSKLFPGSKRLFELADELTELITICKCGKKARFNARLKNNEYTLIGNQVAIDNFDATYEPLCGKCYLEDVLKIRK